MIFIYIVLGKLNNDMWGGNVGGFGISHVKVWISIHGMQNPQCGTLLYVCMYVC